MVAFWQEALHYILREPASNGWAVLCNPKGKGPNLSFKHATDELHIGVGFTYTIIPAIRVLMLND